MDSVPPASQPELRLRWLQEKWEKRQGSEADRHRNSLIKWYGEKQGSQIKFAETFEVCEYGRQPSDREIRQLFPFLPQGNQ